MKTFKLNTTLGIASLLGLAFAASATAGTSPQTTTFTVSTAVPSTCSIGSAGNVSFPNYDVLSASSDTATSTISVTCSKGTQITVALSQGTNSTSYAPRTMQDASANTLNYNLYTGSVVTAACTGGTVWGDASGSTVTQTPAASSSKATPMTLTVYGCIPAGQDVTAGASENYSDTITVSVTFT